ncbi:unnamed protein product [Nyctereutes procyonoides]|uniref:(raccoon dog) hypothetical protein n=1 Tax=Nyctereutes procyonoides TaxID=34880 RepID=A0A811XRM5_NYCPR|nr:unnamed protein product [Nyctereutes procyonoides]
MCSSQEASFHPPSLLLLCSLTLLSFWLSLLTFPTPLEPEPYQAWDPGGLCRQNLIGLTQDRANCPCLLIPSWPGPDQAIDKATTAVCSKIPAVEKICKDILTRFLFRVAQFFLNSDPSRDICVTFRMCRPQVGECQGAGNLLHLGEKHRVSSKHRQLLPS